MEKLWFDLPVKIEINRLQVEHYKNCVFLFLVSRPKMAEHAIEIEKLTFKLSDLQKGRCHIRVVDTPQTQEQSPTLKPDHKKNNSRWTKDTIVKYGDHKDHNKMVAHMFWLTLFIKSENTNQLKTWIESTFHPLPRVKIPLPQEGFPPQILRPRPRPSSSCTSTAAAASMSRSTAETRPLKAAECSGVLPREPRPEGPKPAGRTQRNGRGEKIWENLGTSKVEVLENVDTQTPLWTYGTLLFWNVLRSLSCWKDMAPVLF